MVNWSESKRVIEWMNPDLGIHQPNQWMEGQSTQIGPRPGYTVQPRARIFSTWVHPVLLFFCFVFSISVVIMGDHFPYWEFLFLHKQWWWEDEMLRDSDFYFHFIINIMIRRESCTFLETFLNFEHALRLSSLVLYIGVFLFFFFLFSFFFSCTKFQKITWRCSNVFLLPFTRLKSLSV